MKILHVVASYKPAYVYGGPIMSVAMLCEQLVKAGQQVEVYTTTANGAAELDVTAGKSINVDGVPVTYFPRKTKDHSHFSPELLKAVYRDARQFDVVHVHAWWNLAVVLACFAALKRGVPVVVSPRGTLSSYSFQNKNTGLKSLMHHISMPFLKKSYFHVTSVHEQQAVETVVKGKGINNIPNFVKLPPLRHHTTENESPGVFKLLFFSRIEEKKGLDILISSLKQINSPCHLTVAGSGNDAYVNGLKKLAADSGVGDKITWAGFVNEEKFDLLSKHHLFVLPSYDENFGNAVIESLSVGTAVLISKGVGLAGYVSDNRLGWVCENNETSVAEHINHIISTQNPELDRIRQSAPSIIYHHFEGSALVKKYINMYQQIITA
ncbi:XrtY-associated glycosyltransferase XYAG1 [Mucilaginibacter celer]|uniref:Glycosyltransferase n=1 Tax=Mucilaginibacter celer TaxID=2305508 RepID=A0A494W1W2_9SPHI|nr:glycosyltransferase [Mucilaginibacter celer]AYL97262.1 glycosyltransferase [Mucilaginibacter celer]